MPGQRCRRKILLQKGQLRWSREPSAVAARSHCTPIPGAIACKQEREGEVLILQTCLRFLLVRFLVSCHAGQPCELLSTPWSIASEARFCHNRSLYTSQLLYLNSILLAFIFGIALFHRIRTYIHLTNEEITYGIRQDLGTRLLPSKKDAVFVVRTRFVPGIPWPS